MRDMEERTAREASGYQDSITRLEEDIAKMKVISPVILHALCHSLIRIMDGE